MAKPRDFLLDTNVLIHYARREEVYVAIERRFKFESSQFSPMICCVTLGEIRAFADYHNWGEEKLGRLGAFASILVSINIESAEIIAEYARLYSISRRRGWGIHKFQNDLWIAATANVIGARLLTMDRDFDDLHGNHLDRVLLDDKTGEIIA